MTQAQHNVVTAGIVLWVLGLVCGLLLSRDHYEKKIAIVAHACAACAPQGAP